MLVLLPTATRTWVVATDVGVLGLRFGGYSRNDQAWTITPRIRRGFFCLLLDFLTALLRRRGAALGGELGEELLERGKLLSAAEEVAEHLAVDVVHQLRENREGFLLELHQRVFGRRCAG